MILTDCTIGFPGSTFGNDGTGSKLAFQETLIQSVIANLLDNQGIRIVIGYEHRGKWLSAIFLIMCAPASIDTKSCVETMIDVRSG